MTILFAAILAFAGLMVDDVALPVHTAAPVVDDPDIGWALTIGADTRDRVAASVEMYLTDPDTNAPPCWEDEAVVVVIDHVHPDYGNSIPPGVGLVGCVPLDNLPVTGFRPVAFYRG